MEPTRIKFISSFNGDIHGFPLAKKRGSIRYRHSIVYPRMTDVQLQWLMDKIEAFKKSHERHVVEKKRKKIKKCKKCGDMPITAESGKNGSKDYTVVYFLKQGTCLYNYTVSDLLREFMQTFFHCVAVERSGHSYNIDMITFFKENLDGKVYKSECQNFGTGIEYFWFLDELDAFAFKLAYGEMALDDIEKLPEKYQDYGIRRLNDHIMYW